MSSVCLSRIHYNTFQIMLFQMNIMKVAIELSINFRFFPKYNLSPITTLSVYLYVELMVGQNFFSLAQTHDISRKYHLSCSLSLSFYFSPSLSLFLSLSLRSRLYFIHGDSNVFLD